MSRKNFIYGTLVLTASGFLCRVIGFFYRIFLSHTIGAQGIGLYQLILPVQNMVLALTAVGMQAAISRICASLFALNQKKQARIAFLSGTLLCVSFSAALSVVIYEHSNFLSSEILKEPRTADLIRLLAFSLSPAVLHACTNSYYYAKKQTVFPSALQLLEQLIRVFCTWMLYRIFLSEGRAVTAVIAAGGALASELAAALGSLLGLALDFQHIRLSKLPLHTWILNGRQMLLLALPHSMNKLLLTVLGGMEMILIPQRLQLSGLHSADALSLYGIFTGMALPLILFPSAFTSSASVMLLPSVAELQALGYQKRISYVIRRTCRYCLLLGFSCAFVFFFLGNFLGNFLFHNAAAGNYIRLLSFICPFLYLNMALAGILNGLGKVNLCLLHNVTANSIRIGFVLFSIPVSGIPGYFRGLLLSEALLSFLHLRVLFSIKSVKV